MFHVRKVSRDALERPWHSVCTWSQFVWDSVETGDMCWADRDLIQDERVRLCLTAPAPINTHNGSQNNNRNQHATESMCRAYNSRFGCNQRQSHVENSVLLLHNCSYCDSVGKSCTHPVRDCERRMAHARPSDNNSYNYRRQHNHPTHYQAQYHQQGYGSNNNSMQQQFNPYQNSQFTQAPKNAM